MAVYVKQALQNVITISKIVTIHYYELTKDFVFHGESHDFWEMVYVDHGSVIINADEREFTLKQGELTFHKPNEFHKIRADGIHAPNVFIISFDTRSHMMQYFKDRIISVDPKLTPLISGIISEGKAAFFVPEFDPDLKKLPRNKHAPVGAQQLLRLNLEQLLIMLLREGNTGSTQVFQSKTTFENHLFTLIIDIMKRNLYGKLTVGDICAELHYGKTSLSATFKSVCGSSLMEYYTLLKIAEAKRLLREKNHSIAEISELLQFDSPQYFSKRFKSVTGMTPSAYLKTVDRS